MFLPNSLLEDHPDGIGDLNAIFNGNWAKLNAYVNPAADLTARLDDNSPPGSGNVVNASAAVFTSDDVGAIIFFEDERVNYTIASYVSATKVTVIGSGELTAQSFTIYRLGQSPRTTYMRGLAKRVRMLASDDKKVPRWNHTDGKCDMVDLPGYNVTSGNILFGGGSSTDVANSADLNFNDTTDLLTINGRALAKNFNLTHDTLASGSSIQIDFSLNQLRSISTLAHDATFTAANLAAGRRQTLRIVCDGTGRNLTWPGSWVWLGTAPTAIAASKTGLLTLIAFSSADSGVVAKWEVQP